VRGTNVRRLGQVRHARRPSAASEDVKPRGREAGVPLRDGSRRARPGSLKAGPAGVRLAEGSALTEAELREWCKGKPAHYEIPRYVRVTDEFPMTITGKVQKFKMREVFVEELGLPARRRHGHGLNSVRRWFRSD
jgi:acyl-CoA synthetase (AMP-forming)/AMP-acid ligase II